MRMPETVFGFGQFFFPGSNSNDNHLLGFCEARHLLILN